MAGTIKLRDVLESDLDIFFEHHRDPIANFMAAFTSKDPHDRQAFDSHWQRIMNSKTVRIRTILIDQHVAGSVLSYQQDGHTEVSYWIGREFWGKGSATQALAMFLDQMKQRPVYARAAKDNLASIRVLEKCGFALYGQDRGFANARGKEIDEVIMKLV